MLLSAHDVDLKGNNFRRTIHPQSFIAVAFISSELEREASGSSPPPVQKVEKSPVWIVLKFGQSLFLLETGNITVTSANNTNG